MPNLINWHDGMWDAGGGSMDKTAAETDGLKIIINPVAFVEAVKRQ